MRQKQIPIFQEYTLRNKRAAASHAARLAFARWHGWRPLLDYKPCPSRFRFASSRCFGADHRFGGNFCARSKRMYYPCKACPQERLNAFERLQATAAGAVPLDYKPCCQTRSRSLARLTPFPRLQAMPISIPLRFISMFFSY